MRVEQPAAMQIEEFLLERLLGKGATAEVWLARDTLLDRQVAVKIALAAPSAVERLRFRVEGRAMAMLHHPNLPVVYRVGEVDDRPFVVTELLSGSSLERVARPVPAETVVAIGLDLARALVAAHRMGILHRDVKPANAVMCEDGTVKLVDFGLARLGRGTPSAPAREPAADAKGSGSLDLADTVDASPRASPDAGALAYDATSVFATASGKGAGTPLYMAPEVWRAEPSTSHSDVYSLGALLHELLTGRVPHEALTLETLRDKVLAGPPPDVAALAPSAPPALRDLIGRCLRMTAEERPRAEEVCQSLEAMKARAADRGGDPGGNPYRGLSAFDAEHAALFFGRDAEIATVVAEMRASPFVLVVGASGAGKSSLVRAGVLPRVRAGGLGVGGWQTAQMVPAPHPVERLASALAAVIGCSEGEVSAGLRESPSWLAERLLIGGRRVVLLVDQLEEAWTLCEEDERSAFFDALAELANAGPTIRLVAALRADFLDRLEDMGELQRAALRAPVVVGSLTSEGARRAIVEPARRRGVTVEPALVDELARATDALPLLQFALTALWERRAPGGTVLRAADLEALGGFEGALAARANAALAGLAEPLQAEARRLLLSLVTLERMRARREERDLTGDDRDVGDVRAALAALVEARLVVASPGESSTVYEIAHEAIVTGWPTMRAWLDEEDAARAVAARVKRAAAEWNRLGRGKDGLLGERQLDELRAMGDSALEPGERTFVAASEAGVRRVRRNRWTLRIGAPLAVAAVAGAALAGMDWRERRAVHRFVDARLAEAEAASREALELDLRVEAARARAFERFDHDDDDGGEAAWRDALMLAHREEERFGVAAEALGFALARDPRSREIRVRAAEQTFLWLLAAERDGENDLMRELRDRLVALDDDGTRTARLDAPSHLRVSTVPAAGRLLVHRVRATAEGRRVEDEGHALDPGVAETLAPGSYVLDAELAGRRAARMPCRLHRGEDLTVEIDLPAPADVPDGFVYVPAGRTLFGSADVQAVRLTSGTQPEHPLSLGAYLVAAHETTIGEYLRFLSSLPPAERELRRPHSTHVDLFFGPDGAAVFTLGDQRVRQGEALCRPKRTARRCQDWSRMPIVGVTWESAAAYARWVAATALPGARLCTEREWQRAGRGADERTFPWGDRPLPGDANFEETYESDPDLMGIDEVGSFPIDRSVFGVVDLAGNATEWLAGAAGPSSGMHAAAGGATHQSSVEAPVNLHHAYPEGTYGDVGLRLCASPRAQ